MHCKVIHNHDLLLEDEILDWDKFLFHLLNVTATPLRTSNTGYQYSEKPQHYET
jgi:hypothetical protein